MPGSKKQQISVMYVVASVLLNGVTYTERIRINTKAFQDFSSSDNEEDERVKSGLGHIASVMKGVLRRKKILSRDQNPWIPKKDIRISPGASGPKSLPRK